MNTRYNDYDLIILGGGSGGVIAGVTAGAAGLRTLLIEKTRLGGAWLNTGGVPSKALLHAANVAHQMSTADTVGLKSVKLSREDAADVLRHVRGTIAEVEDAEATADQLRKYGVTIRIGDARFISPEAIELEEREGPTRTLTAENFLIATGSGPERPDIPGLAETGYLTHNEVFDLEEIPETMIVIGGGTVGVELAQAFNRLGSTVTVLEKGPRILPNDDFEAADALLAALRAEGVDVRTDTEVVSVRQEAGRKVVRIRHDDHQSDVSAHALLVAVGRAPNVQGMNLEAARIEYDARGVKVNPKLHTTGPRAWACGDVIGRYPFSHLAEHESRIVVRNILFPFDQRADEGFKLAPWATFTEPEVAHVGLTEAQAQAKGVQYRVFRQPFGRNDRALVEGEPAGFVKVLATGWQGRVLGAHIVGPRAGELIQEWVQAMTRGLTLRQVADTIHVYPTLSMANQHAATRWYEEQAESPLVRGAVETYTRAVRPNLGRLAAGLAGALVIAGSLMVAQSLQKRRD